MKKLLSIILCLNMIMAIMPAGAGASNDNIDTLEKFGFSPDPDSYDTNALKPGKHIIDQRYDLFADFGFRIQKRQYTKTKTSDPAGKSYKYNISDGTDYSNGKSDVFFTTTAFDPTGSKADNYLARITLADNIWGGQLKLSVFDSVGNVIIDNYVTTGHVSTSTQIHVWDLEGLIAINAGDFDGDGKDELAVYTPNNYKETQSGSVHADIFVNIYKIDVNSKSVTNTQTIDLSSRSSASEVCEWEYTYKDKAKRFYCIPYVALSAEDLNGDGTDDLMATVNFSTYARGTGYKTKYTTKQILDHNSYFASVLEAYEGTKGGKLVQTVKHKMLVTTKIGDYRYVLRNANAIVADVTADGSKEIVIGGNYTRVTYKSTHSSTTVNENRGVWIDGEDAARNIIGFTTYEDLKNYNPADADSPYYWTVRESGLAQLHYYEDDDDDPTAEPVSLCGYKPFGFGTADELFLEGQIFVYSPDENKLVYSYDVSASVDDGDFSNIWLGKAVTANVGNDMFSREVLMFIYGYKISGKDKYGWKLVSHYGIYNSFIASDRMRTTKTTTLLSTKEGKSHVTLALVDNGTKSTYVEYEEGNTDVYYSDIDILAIMQAPPVYEELNDDSYIGNSETSFTKSKGEGTGSSLGGSLTAGVVTGFEQETSFLGLFKCGGAEYELKVTGTVSYDDSTETNYDYSTGFATSGTTDAVTIFTVPYVRYNCTMFMPGYVLPTEAQYNELCSFRDELESNLNKCLETGQAQNTGSYIKGCDYYEYAYTSYVDSSNYNSQLDVYKNVIEQISAIEKSVESFGKGGTNTWGETIAEAVVPYRYCIPQTPMVTTLDVNTYDEIAKSTPGLEEISDKVFGKNYKAGDPGTYAHDTKDLPVSSSLLTAKTNVGSSADGFLSNTAGSSSATLQSQTISVEKSDSKTLGWGAALENTSVANVAGIKLGFTVTAEINGSNVWTTTSGNEYSGTVVSLPSGTSANYAYGWKLVSYNTRINGAEVPVVGYLTKITTTPPPSIPQNISVENITDSSATITWEEGSRPASYYALYRKTTVNDKEHYTELSSSIKPDNDGRCSYTVSNLKPLTTSSYIIKSYSSSGIESVSSEEVSLTTLPKGFNVTLDISGINSGIVYQKDIPVTLRSTMTGNEDYETFYQWQIDKGNGWENVPEWSTKDVSFEMTPSLNNCRIRNTAIVSFDGNISFLICSSPITILCAESGENYSVDWDTDATKVTVNLADYATDSKIYIAAYDSNGVLQDSLSGDYANNTFDILPYVTNGYTVRAFVWDNNMAPMGYVFERRNIPLYDIVMDGNNIQVNLDKGMTDAQIIAGIYNEDALVTTITGDYENNVLNIANYINKGYTIKVFVWDENLRPLGVAYVK